MTGSLRDWSEATCTMKHVVSGGVKARFEAPEKPRAFGALSIKQRYLGGIVRFD